MRSPDSDAGETETDECAGPQGAEVVERLNESGELRRMLQRFKVGGRWREEQYRQSAQSVNRPAIGPTGLFMLSDESRQKIVPID